MTLVEQIARTCQALRACNGEWRWRHNATLDAIEKLLPSGAGLDTGTTIDREKSGIDRVVMSTSYHHMTNHGFYDGWTDHRITVTPSFAGPIITISGRDKNGIKEYLGELFGEVLQANAYDA